MNQSSTAQTINLHISSLSLSAFTTYIESMSGSWGLAKPTVNVSGGIATITMPASSIVTLQGSTANNANVTGSVYADNDDNGTRGTGDTNFSNVRIYDDANLNGVYDAGEASVFTDTSGNYTLGNLAAGSHRIKVEVPAGNRSTQPTSGQYDITLAAGQAYVAAAFGLTAKAKFSGTAYIDNDNNGTFSSGDTYYSAAQVFIDSNNDGVWQSTEPTSTTNTYGLYSFNNLAAGTYRVRVVSANNYVVTTPSVGYRDVTVTAGQFLTSQSLGLRQLGTAQIQGTLYKDNDNSGGFTSGDTYLVGMVVWLDLNQDGIKDANEPTSTTNSFGQYSFTNLLAGTYRVHPDPLSGWHIFNTPLGYRDIVVTANQSVTGFNFAYQIG